MLKIDNIPDQTGYLILTDDGAVIGSGGDLENDEARANIISSLLALTESIDPAVFPKNSCKKISIVYEEHSYIICLSNSKIYVVKRRNPADLGEENAGLTL